MSVNRKTSSYFQWSASGLSILALLTLLLMFNSETPFMVLFTMIVIAAAGPLLWREGEPPIMFSILLLQWMSVSAAVFVPMMNGVSMSEYYRADKIEIATWLSLIGLFILMIGMRLGMIGLSGSQFKQSRFEMAKYSVPKLWMAYIAAFIAFVVLMKVRFLFSGLSQFILALQSFKSAFFFLLLVTVFTTKKGYGLLIIAVLIELFVGIIGFFSGFKEVFFLIALALFATKQRVTKRLITFGFVIFALVMVLSATWSEVKMEYRDFLNRGTGSQIVVVDVTDRLDKITDLASKMNGEKLNSGFTKLLDRIAYTHYFGLVLETVPNIKPHTDGEQWMAALKHILQPRLFFPDKKALTSDVTKLDKYTQLNLIVQGGRQTEIPMGYMAESYIDFGYVVMFIPIFFLGFLYGKEYKYFASRRQYLLFSYGAVIVILSVATKYETTIIKIIGGNLMMLIAMLFILKFIVPVIDGWLSNKPRALIR